jgi:FKBP-type peptidyl-prolyl cis-trans isomerase SlyD
MQVNKNLVVSFEYTLTNDAGETLDKSDPGKPMAYLHGHHNIVPGLEREMEGKTVGDSFTAHVAPEDGYGVKKSDSTQVLPLGAFGDTQPEVGSQYATRTDKGHLVPLWVTAVSAEGITITFDHPLAGQTLHFDVRIAGIREASPEELAQGHPRGPGGHHH